MNKRKFLKDLFNFEVILKSIDDGVERKVSFCWFGSSYYFGIKYKLEEILLIYYYKMVLCLKLLLEKCLLWYFLDENYIML